MSLPHQLLSAEYFTLPAALTPLGIGGITLNLQDSVTPKQIPFAQMERLSDQLVYLSEYSNHLFIDLANQTLRQKERLEKLSETFQRLSTTRPTQPPLLETVIKRIAWKSGHSINSNMFTKGTLPTILMDRYKQCQEAPTLNLLDRFRLDGFNCMRVLIVYCSSILIPNSLWTNGKNYWRPNRAKKQSVKKYNQIRI
jgi:hypothetical protein